MTMPQTWFLCAAIIFFAGVLLWALVIRVQYDAAEKYPSEDTQKD